MSVTVDREPLAAEQFDLKTVGQVLAHVQRNKRLVTHLLIDGQEPDLDRISTIRHSLVTGHTLFIETADPAIIALDALEEVEDQLQETQQVRTDAVGLLQAGQSSRAMEKLSGCFSSWQAAQECVLKVAQLLRIDLEGISVRSRSLTELLEYFNTQLREIKKCLEHRDFVTLADILSYEADETSSRWRDVFASMRDAIQLTAQAA